MVRNPVVYKNIELDKLTKREDGWAVDLVLTRLPELTEGLRNWTKLYGWWQDPGINCPADLIRRELPKWTGCKEQGYELKPGICQHTNIYGELLVYEGVRMEFVEVFVKCPDGRVGVVQGCMNARARNYKFWEEGPRPLQEKGQMKLLEVE